jgi:hypothetical protein
LLEQNRYEKNHTGFLLFYSPFLYQRNGSKKGAADHPPFSLLATKRDCPALLKSAVSLKKSLHSITGFGNSG